MARSYVALLLVLTSIWGASFMFIKVAVDEMAPSVLVLGRVGLASVAIVAFLALRGGTRRALSDIRATGRDGVALGALNAAIPFWLISWGETHVDSGVAAIANASVPFFVVLLAVRFRPSERLVGLRLFGLVLGFVGVGVLAGAQPEGGLLAVVGTLAVVLASLSYAAGALFGQHLSAGASGAVLGAATTIWATVFMAPFAALELPAEIPSGRAIASVCGLALLGTALGQLIYYRMIRLHGSTRASLVTHLVPGMALVYGAVLLAEPLTFAKIGGLLLILAGVALSSGVIRSVWRRRPVPSPAP